jgi:hypothetical protein
LVMRTIRCLVSFILVIAGIGLLAWASIPARRQVFVQRIPVTAMQAPKREQEIEQAIPQARQVRLEWPESLRIGDQAMISLDFLPLKEESDTGVSAASISNAYASYNLMAEGRFEVAGVNVDPANPRRESLPQGASVNYQWKISAADAGSYPGEVWLSLRFLPLNGGQASNVPIFVHEVNIRATSLFGLSGPLARGMGGVGIVVGLGMSFDVMIGMIKRLTNKGTRGTKVYYANL